MRRQNAEWINHGPASVPYMGNFSGRLPAFFQAIGDSVTDAKVVADKFIAQGDTVAATRRYMATVRSTGAKIDSPLAHVFTVRNGKVGRWIGFSDSAAWPRHIAGRPPLPAAEPQLASSPELGGNNCR
jgi:uncharacterized protein